MFRNYLTLAFRNISRQKAFSFINITGLAIGLASSLIIFLWVQDERSFDTFHEKANRTYRLTASATDLSVAISPAPMAPALAEAVPAITHHTRMSDLRSAMFQANDRKFEEKNGFYAEPSFFQVFDFRLKQGNVETALQQPNSVILSEELALKYFGTADVLGKTLRKDNTDDFVVTGILEKPAGNSHLRFDMLLPWAYIATRENNIKENIWGNFDYFSYISFDTAKDEVFLNDVIKKADALFLANEARVKVQFSLQPLTDIHLHSDFMADVPGHGSAQYVTIFMIIAVFIVLIGCINFMNLSTARAARRAKEVGLRKVAGAVRWQLINQFLGESIVISSIALMISIVIAILALPAVNDLTGKHLAVDLNDPFTLLLLGGVTLITGILSGLYPAFILSGFTPVRVLKKDVKGTGGVIFRNFLVVTQFVVSIVLLAGTAIVYQQRQYISNKDLGFTKENLLYVELHGDVHAKMNMWRTAFSANPATANATFTSGLPTNHVSGTASVSWPGKDPDKQIMFALLFIDEHFIPVYDMQLVSGRNFYHELRGDSTNLIINEKAAEAMGFTAESVIGQPVEMWDTKGVIIGVVKDFNFKPLQEMIEPMILGANKWGGVVTVKAESGKTHETLAALESVWNSMENVYPFAYNFVDQDLANLYQSEKQVGTLFFVFALLAIIISCLGLYGLSAYIAEQRTREIGIRKALGASIVNIVYLLNTCFIIPVGIAMLIAAPLAWYGMDKWLQGFAYRVDFNWILVAGAGGVALLISLLTVSYESLKAAKVNPVKSLRTE
ncbi:MAG TPA: ABC transporter permease [Ohtaekwangia sp.]